MEIPTNDEEQTFSPFELRQNVLGKIENILEEAGVQTDDEIVTKEVKGEDSNLVFQGSEALQVLVVSEL